MTVSNDLPSSQIAQAVEPTATEKRAVSALADVASNTKKGNSYLVWWLTVQSFLQSIGGAAALSDYVGTRNAGVFLVILSGLNAATATYLAHRNSKIVTDTGMPNG